MNVTMTFPETWEEFEKAWGITDTEHVYTNGAELIPSFRVKQWLNHIGYKDTKEQATEIVRCKDCKHWDNIYNGYCYRLNALGMKPDDFCSLGERKEE